METRIKYIKTTNNGWLYAKCCGDEEPKSYPCILLDMEEYICKWDDFERLYDFVYLTDFISDYGK